jgi:hypothetical protein
VATAEVLELGSHEGMVGRKTVDQYDGWCTFACLFIKQRDTVTLKLLHDIPPWSNDLNFIALQWAS